MALPHFSELTNVFYAQGQAIFDVSNRQQQSQMQMMPNHTIDMISLHNQLHATDGGYLPPFSFFHPTSVPMTTTGENFNGIGVGIHDRMIQYQEETTPSPSLLMTPTSPTKSSSSIYSNEVSPIDGIYDSSSALDLMTIGHHQHQMTCGSVTSSRKARRNSLIAKPSRQAKKDWVDALQKQMLEVIDRDEKLVRRAKTLENEVSSIKTKLKGMGFTDAQISDIVNRGKREDSVSSEI